MALALTVGVLIGGGVFMMLRRGMVRLIIGFALLSHGVNLLIMSTGGIDRRGEPLGSSPDPATTADALPQAFVLTAIVIAFAITVYLLVLAVTGPEDEDGPDPVREDGTRPAAVGTLEDVYDEFGEPAGSTDPHAEDGGPPPDAERTGSAPEAERERTVRTAQEGGGTR